MPLPTPLKSSGKKTLTPEGGRVPPASLEAEQSVLGGILIKAGAIDLVVDLLSPEDFYHEGHGIIYRAMLELYQRREPVDLVTVTTLLNSHQLLDAVGGPGFLLSLSEQVPTAVNIEYYAKIVQEKSILRRLIACTNEIAQECYEPQDDVEKFLDEAEHRIFAIAEAKMRPGVTPLSDLIDLEINRLEKLFATKCSTTGVPSHFRDLDEYTHGFQKSDLIILAARPSMGKTALALNIAYNAAHYHQVPVAIFSLEMSKEQLVRRLFSAVARIDASALRRGFFSREEFALLQEAASFMMNCPIFIDDTPAARVLEVRAKCRRLKRDKNLGAGNHRLPAADARPQRCPQPGTGDFGNLPLPQGPGQGIGCPGAGFVPTQPPGGRTPQQEADAGRPAGIRSHRTGRRCHHLHLSG